MPRSQALQGGVVPVPDFETVEEAAKPLAAVDESLMPHQQEVVRCSDAT